MRYKNHLISCLLGLILSQCIPSEYEELTVECIPSEPIEWMTVLKNYLESGPTQIKEALSIEGYIISSSEEGQFYAELIIQNSNEFPTKGMRILTDATHLETNYPKGSFVRFELQGLYIQHRNNSFNLGGALPSFGTIILGRIPTNDLKGRLSLLCDAQSLEPIKTSIAGLKDLPLHSLIKLDSLRFKSANSLLNFSNVDEETYRMLIDCTGDSIAIKTSNYSNFASEQLPHKMGDIQAVLKQDKSRTYLEIARLNDVNFNKQACELPPLFMSSNQLLISEWADPSNNTKARFIELFNSSDESLSLNGWTLVRYTNDNTDPGFSISLNELIVESKQAVVIASNAEEFKSVYGFEADLYSSSSSAAGSNGDDQVRLIDPFGVIIDQFGIIGEDGTGTAHDFEDGKAIRKNEITQASATFDASQWMIYNKRGGVGTIRQSLIAPEDYSPGHH